MSTYPYTQPSVQEVTWQGPDLAIDQLRTYLNQIKSALFPPRGDIIGKAVDDGLKVIQLLEQFVQSLPPGAA